MTFESEEIKDKYFDLPIDTQLEYIEYEQKLQEHERQIHVLAVSSEGPLQVIVRITD